MRASFAASFIASEDNARTATIGPMVIPLVLALLLAHSGLAQESVLTSGRPLPPEQACYDVEGYDLSIRVDPEQRSIAGRVYVNAEVIAPSDWIVLDLDDRLEVSDVSCAQAIGFIESEDDLMEPVRFERGRGEIRIYAPTLFRNVGSGFRVRVTYSGKPREAPRPPWDGGFVWAKTPSGKPWIATANQMQGADLWWPCKDQPDDEADRVTLRVTVPKPLVVASNGRLNDVLDGYDVMAGKETRPGWHTYHWFTTTPINSYGIALNIAPYETITRNHTSVAGDTFPVTYWVLPENLARGKVLFEDILRQMAFFERVFGPYPFRADKYGVAETPHLGMEHQTIIAYGNDYRGGLWGEDRGYDELHLHEFAHEWWANLVTARNWNDFWIHEGFASYAQALYAEHVGGEKAYFTELREQRHFANRAAVAPREPRSTAEMYFGDVPGSPGGDIYSKGAWIVHSLRWALGDEPFFRVLRRSAYPDPALEASTDGRACRFATTDELLGIAESVSGRELDWFFEVYLRQPALPELVARKEGETLHLEWRAPGGRPFPMPVEVQLGAEHVRVECPDGKGTLHVGAGVTYAVDPRERVLCAGVGAK
jgi:aminopeptidase N